MKIIFLSLYSWFSFGMTPDLHELPEHKSYFKFYLAVYSNWYHANFFDWNKYLPSYEQNLLQEAIKSSHHWLDKRLSQELPRVLYGTGYDSKNKKMFYTLEISLDEAKSKGLRLKWSTLDNSSCYGTKTLDYKCYRAGESEVFLSYSLSKRKIHKKYFFKQEKMSSKTVLSEFIYTDEFHHLDLPIKLRSTAIKHGQEAQLPLDKIERYSNGNYIIYYP